MPDRDLGNDALEAIFTALDRLGEAARVDVDSVRCDVTAIMEKVRNAEAAADAAALEVKLIRDLYSIQAREISEMVKFITANLIGGKAPAEPDTKRAAPDAILNFQRHYEPEQQYPPCSLVRAYGRVWISKRHTSQPIPERDVDLDETDDWYLLA